ncbi:S-adenosyl-L-methionine-dependent methyltransferase [Nemania abortiva]|nr:S-adenosyl-L-methionine-dependent methyltransferase [Nemania abortiva]
MNAEECDGAEAHNKKKRLPRRKLNPIEAAISAWFEQHAVQLKNQHDVGDLIAQAPKRWTAYGPLVLLPAGSFTSPAWREVLDLPSDLAQSAGSTGNDKGGAENQNLSGPSLLWRTILTEISGASKAKLTHLAINEGIPLHSKDSESESKVGAGIGDSENILRSPSGLRMLHGDFGPSEISAPTEADFTRAFWVSTKQNGITQIWAPRWTMFSRGNIKEKARLLAFHDNTNTKDQNGSRDHDSNPLSHRHITATERAGAVAVDLYAGIGYFAFCYAALGFRVLCWELNPWSVEGLRRGAAANGWGVRVVVPPEPGPEHGAADEGEDRKEGEMFKDILTGNETIVVFLEDNTRAANRIRKLDELAREHEERIEESRNEHGDEKADRGLRMRDVMHVNLGLLPSSRGSWATAWDIASQASQAWFHVHENVGVADIEAKKEEIREWFVEQMVEDRVQTDLRVEHVEMVKTFAPGVWHCVFDLYVRRQMDAEGNIT